MAQDERLEGTRLWSLVPGNDPDADRINLVFSPWGWDDFDTFVTTMRGSLSWDGHAYYVDADWNVTPDRSEAMLARMGMFAIEPFRSQRDRFNVWYSDLGPSHPDPGYYLSAPDDDTDSSWVDDGHPFALDDVAVVIVAAGAENAEPPVTSAFALESASWHPGEAMILERPLERPTNGDPFGFAVLVTENKFPAVGLAEMVHEIGHSMFFFPDEYVGTRNPFDPRNERVWPSCATDRAEAEAWWGDLVGQVDPMFDIWVEEMARAGFPLDTDLGIEGLRDRIEIGYVDGGCFGAPESYRPSTRSLMFNSMSVFGSVNRRWVETILDLWEGAPRP